MATAMLGRAPSGATTAAWDVDDLLRELRHRRFDLDRRLYVGYAVETGHQRETAYTLRQCATDDGWQASLYADGSGFVVRFGRRERVTRELLVAEQSYLDSLVETHGATIRAVSVEDLDGEDTWTRLAAQQSGEPVPTVPAKPPVISRRRPAVTCPSAQAATA